MSLQWRFMNSFYLQIVFHKKIWPIFHDWPHKRHPHKKEGFKIRRIILNLYSIVLHQQRGILSPLRSPRKDFFHQVCYFFSERFAFLPIFASVARVFNLAWLSINDISVEILNSCCLEKGKPITRMALNWRNNKWTDWGISKGHYHLPKY